VSDIPILEGDSFPEKIIAAFKDHYAKIKSGGIGSRQNSAKQIIKASR
jgi:hypothetical protein